ncbi:MAG: AAA family ATPase [Bacteroidota bacterium]|jgi:AAA+ ATPase superfamily predicted ATPase
MVGRYTEIARLNNSLKSSSSELIAVYGRRRIGKTYLIRNVLQKKIVFEMTGLYNGTTAQQIGVFMRELHSRSKKFKKTETPENWERAFELLKLYLNTVKNKSKKVIFIDEFPWFDGHKSDFLKYFGHFWNSYCEKRKDLLVVICGSAASYMIKNIISNRGSLHARLTYSLRLMPFSLHETKLYLESKKIKWSNYNILQLYNCIGGIPHYLSKIKKEESVVQNIQRLCFNNNADLAGEFNTIFESLFDQSETHISIIRKLGNSRKGLTRDELIRATGFSGGGFFSKTLEELIASGFVTDYPAYNHKAKLTLYRLSDEYSRFYLKYIEKNKSQGNNFWKTMSQQSSYLSWAGYNFETACLKHIQAIKKALGIEGIHSVSSSWTGSGIQIDLLIARKDNWVNICEMKFYNGEYVINRSEFKKLQDKIQIFSKKTGAKSTVVLTFISTFGVKENEYEQDVVNDNFKADILFAPIN